MAIIVTRRAGADLAAIRDYIGKDNPAAASRVAVQLLATCDALEYLPERGAPGFYPGTRVAAVFWPYVITYRIVGADVVILRIRHGARIQRSRHSVGEI